MLKIESQEQINDAINHNKDYICSETLTSSLEIVEKVDEQSHELEIDTDVKTKLSLQLA